MIWLGLSAILACSALINGAMALACTGPGAFTPTVAAFASAAGALCCATAALVTA